MIRGFVASALLGFAMAYRTPVLVDEGLPALFYASQNAAPLLSNGPSYIDEEDLHPGVPLEHGTLLVHPPKPLLPPEVQMKLNAVRAPKPRGTPVGNNNNLPPRIQSSQAVEEPYTIYKPVKPFARVNLDSNGFVYPHPDMYAPATYVQHRVRPIVTPITVHGLRGGCRAFGTCY